MDKLSSSAVSYLIHHIFLPPKLPNQDDSSPENESALLNTTIDALEEFKKWTVDDNNAAVDAVIDMVKGLELVTDFINSNGAINERELSIALKDLPQKGGTILLHIRAQNAGIMISKVDSSIHVEAFELSPRNEDVLTTKGRLRRSFPGPALALTIDAFEQPGLQSTMAHTLAKMSHQSAVETQPQVWKAGRLHDESRDTTHPKMVTELFMAFLSPSGEPVNVLRLNKNTREEVMWHDALSPWRRSPLWILLRVAIQLIFSRLAGSENPSASYYKTFMLVLMGKVLQLSLQHEIPCDLLYVMNAKLGRRLLKLDSSSAGGGIAFVQCVMSRTAKIIQERWDGVMQRTSTHHDLSILESLEFQGDSLVRLRNLTNFLTSLSTMADWTASDTFKPTSVLAKHQPGALPKPLDLQGNYQFYNLRVFETWVALHLPQWIENHKGGAETCSKLSALIKEYYLGASAAYAGNPESFSNMILTILELWIACDRSALHICDLLKDYDPGIPLELAESLILPFKDQMQRLLRAEEYLKQRQKIARQPSPSIFRDYGQWDCFAVKYFNISPSHQQLRQKIEDRATQLRNAKVNELHQKQEQYRSLMQQYERSSCKYYTAFKGSKNVTYQKHSHQCQRCRYRSKANSIGIQVYEWPLPQKDLEAKSTVFELDVPSFFGQWRDTALFLLLDVFKIQYANTKKPQPTYPLREYSGLKAFFKSPSLGQRVTLLSETKPHEVTHRRNKSIATATEDNICLQNGLRYQYYDNFTRSFVGDLNKTSLISDSLNYTLPKPSSALQRFLLPPSDHPWGSLPNTVIASQCSCPRHMSLDEYKALCTIPLGYRSHWLNILTQLSAPSVDFRKVETALVILKSIYRAGPSEDQKILRTSHDVLDDQNFARALLEKLDESLQRVRENWESSQAVGTFIAISARLLSLTSTKDVETLCLDFLNETRAITFGWVNLLNDKAYRATDDGQRLELLAHAVEIALICVETFNVDDRYLGDIFSSHGDGRFPTYFTTEFVHWYNETDDCVEFRLAKEAWDSSPDNWKLIRDPGDNHWRLARNGVFLVSIKSKTVKAISSILSPLEDISRLHILLQCSSSSLEIELPRLSLAFTLKSGTSLLRSKQYRGLAIDPDQSLATLVGLQNKLLLRDNASGRRSVIIPEGHVSYRRDGDHVHVTIAHDAMAKAHAYPVDRQLGRLVDNGTLQSKLWICYLHALTSFCVPDPLLQRTGTEQALVILNSAAVRSFDQLSQENIHVLDQIGRLTAARRYYPAHEKVMQTVKWDPKLGFLIQHGGFSKAVKLIFAQADRTRIFYPESCISLPTLNHVEPDLQDRDCIRSSTFCVSGFGAEDHTTGCDKDYLARDQDQNSPQAAKAFAMSSYVFLEHPAVCCRVQSDLSARLWSFLSQNSSIPGPESLEPSSELCYDSGLLQDWSEIASKHWCALHRAFSKVNDRFDKFRLMIWLGTLAFAKDSDMQILQTLASFFVLNKMAEISPPTAKSFELTEGLFRESQLRSALETALRPYSECPESQLAQDEGESIYSLESRWNDEFKSNQDQVLDELIQELEKQWPCDQPVWPHVPQLRTYMDENKAMQIALAKFKKWHDNYLLKAYLHKVEDVLQEVKLETVSMRALCSAEPISQTARRCGFISIDDMLSTPPASLSSTLDSLPSDVLVPISTSNEHPRLASLLSDIGSLVTSNFEKRYVQDLQTSLESLQCRDKEYHLASEGESLRKILRGHLTHCEDHVQQLYSTIAAAGTDLSEDMSWDKGHEQKKHWPFMKSIKQWPRLCPMLFLQQLNRNRWHKLTPYWKQYIVRYAIALTELQRAERLISLLGSPVDLVKELRNTGHTNWDPFEHPEALLLEVESGFLIRGVQEDIAREMRDVLKNATMQLNMGEGKSSVIVPLVAASLADGSRLVRIITAKPQAKQMQQMLVSKLGGLLNRRVCHMPFSRSLRLEAAGARMIGDMCRDIMAEGDILLVQPEHILSFKLMGLECLITGKDQIGRTLLHTQDFFEESSRDIVDESDENFSVRFELIYTMGMQRPVELSPRRWICIQQVLGLVRELATQLKLEAPSSMEIHESAGGSFPRTRVLDSDGQQRLCNRIAKHICEIGLEGFPITRQPRRVREAVLKYISKSDLSTHEVAQVESKGRGGFWTKATKKTLLLLRGLLAGGILSFAFSQKRWRVQYGLDPSRSPPTKLAVPYRAKDSPSLRSEFSHPDVVIVLTCLSHYYGGMTNDDLFLALDHLLKSDQADVEFQEWVKDAPELPPAFRQLSGINLKDRVQCVEQLFPPLRFAKNVIDYFLTHLVFPKEMREFPHKLSTSGWDIGQVKELPTSGFSGTNDSRMTLPLSVSHLDLPEQKHTNALVLEHLLQPENTVMLMSAGAEDSKSTAESLLDMVTEMKPPAQVILDVGAQIIELSNVEVAREWLKRTQGHEAAQAVVFFNEDDELSVLDRKGRIERLQTSPFAGQLDVCLVFLDESHTRGTDLKLPDYYKAAVTLGANLTKDTLIQETWTDIRRSMPLWAVQGERFEYQCQLWAAARTGGESQMSRSQAEKFLEDESFSLESRYRPSRHGSVSSKLDGGNENLQHIRNRCLEFDGLEHGTASLQEEQERELSPEIVEERQVQRPAPATAAKHSIHPDLIAFVKKGTLRAGSEAFKPAFETLRNTSAAEYLDVSQFPTDVLVTVDFAKTVQKHGRSVLLDTYQRPVQWILTGIGSGSDKVVKHMVIISPYEAELLQTEVRCSTRVTLHLYAPRPNLGIRPIDRLDLYTISGMSTLPTVPSRFITQLNLFAGQLYLDSFKEYVEVCTMLGLAWKKAEEGMAIAADGFIIQDDAPGWRARKSTFAQSPVAFLRVFLTKIRKNCEEIAKTHMGAILGGRLLRPADFGEPDEVLDALSH
ncbi:hypothetical protein DV738_g1146, partial [Chaetothyriales sp. CBS 135597]